jgi:hypothetical protein
MTRTSDNISKTIQKTYAYTFRALLNASRDRSRAHMRTRFPMVIWGLHNERRDQTRKPVKESSGSNLIPPGQKSDRYSVAKNS